MLVNDLSLARQCWQLFGVSYLELKGMDFYDVEMLKIYVSKV